MLVLMLMLKRRYFEHEHEHEHEHDLSIGNGIMQDRSVIYRGNFKTDGFAVDAGSAFVIRRGLYRAYGTQGRLLCLAC